ncbi:MAG: DNA polymerase III subunit gamma/tau [Acidipila sp.]|nr:DNA polymerase III subunit gamma/tau [Acidipila sp.]
MSYQVIARKWRPQTFSEVVGQQHVTRTLSNAIAANRVAHAYIFSGPRGVGKTTTARILAKALNCIQGPTAEPCNVCDACRDITAGSSMDVIEIDAASNRGIDQIRELREMVRYAAAGGRNRVVILDEAHQLTDEASNALLKTLEEPPPGVLFVLATTQADELPDTIRSRAQRFHFRALSFDEIVQALEPIAKKENLEIDAGALAVIARTAEGSLRDALSLTEQAIAYCGNRITDAQVRELLGVVPEEVLDEMIGAAAAASSARALSLVHRLIAQGQNLQHFCREAIRHVRNLLVARVCGGESELIAAPREERQRLADQAAQFSEEDLTRLFSILLDTDADLRRKPDPRLHLEMGLLRMVNAARLAPLEEVLASLSAEGASAPRTLPAPRAANAVQLPVAQVPIAQAPSPLSSRPTASAVKLPVVTQRIKKLDVVTADAGAGIVAQTRPLASSLPGSLPVPAGSAVPGISPITAAPPSVVARAVATTDGLEAAQVDALLAAIRQRKKMLASMIEHVTRWEVSGGEMRLYFPGERRAVAEMMQARDTLEGLRAIASEVLGQPLRVCVKLDPARTSGAPAVPSSGRGRAELRAHFEQDPVVRAMLERFGGQIMDVRRRDED